MKREVHVRLIHDGVQPGPALDELLRSGAQDAAGGVYPGTAGPGAERWFDLVLDVGAGAADRPVFGGPFVHGPPTARFLYLSWKRGGERRAPWDWRSKVPLTSIGWAEVREAERDGVGLIADGTGRRPHMSEPVIWRMEPIDPPGPDDVARA